MITKEQISEWRKLKNDGLTSAIGEYTPSEFWECLDEIERLNTKIESLETEKITMCRICAAADVTCEGCPMENKELNK